MSKPNTCIPAHTFGFEMGGVHVVISQHFNTTTKKLTLIPEGCAIIPNPQTMFTSPLAAISNSPIDKLLEDILNPAQE